MAFDAQRTVGELVAERISRASVFDRFGIDYCCNGQVPLSEVCRKQGIGLDDVVGAIVADDAGPQDAADRDYASMALKDLADHIETTHHAAMKRELPRLQALLAKVVHVHGSRHPELGEVAMTFADLKEEMDSHMMKEERVLFPMIRQLEAATSLPSFHCGSLKNPIHMMEHEHDSAGAALAKMRELTGGYATPADGCMSYHALMDGLAAVEHDLHRHIHKENNILFPRTAALEAKLATTAQG